MKKTVILIIADQLRADCFGAGKRLPVSAASIDGLRADSVVFDNAYTQSPVCAPARSSIFTGCVPEKRGTVLNPGILPVNGVPENAVNLARAFSQGGYNTRHYGKWNLDAALSPLAYGFDYFMPLLPSVNKTPHEGTKDEVGYFLDAYEKDDAEITASDLICEQIEADLMNNDDDIYMQIEFPEPHIPYTPKRKFYKQYENSEVYRYPSFDGEKFTDKPYIQRQQLYTWGIENYSFEAFEVLLRHYYGFVSELDAHVGAITAALKKANRYEDAVIVFTADHGDICGSHRMFDKHYIMYNDVMKIPYSVKLPGAQPGVRGELINGSLDTLPTLLSLCSLPYDESSVDGISLARLIKNEGSPESNSFVTASYSGAQFGLFSQRMITDGRYKYIWNACDRDELYDLERDEWECENLIHNGEYAAVLQKLREQLYSEMNKLGDGIGGNEWTRRQLLGGNKL